MPLASIGLRTGLDVVIGLVVPKKPNDPTAMSNTDSIAKWKTVLPNTHVEEFHNLVSKVVEKEITQLFVRRHADQAGHVKSCNRPIAKIVAPDTPSTRR